MKKIIAIVLSFAFILSFAACGAAAIEDTNDRGEVTVYLDGKEVAKVTVADFAKNTTEKAFGEDNYYGKELSSLLKKTVDMKTVKAAFTKSTDGYAAYFETPADALLATFKADENGEMQAVEGFTLVAGEKDKAKQVSEIYLLTKAQDWTATFTIDGKDTVLTIKEFMALKPQYVTLRHKYDGGSATFEGEFLAVDTKTLYESFGLTMTEGVSDNAENGNKVFYADGYDISFTGGVQSNGSEIAIKENKDLKSDPLVEKSGWLCNYFVLVNGNSYHDIVGADLGLSCILSGTGMRWMCTPLQTVVLTKTAE